MEMADARRELLHRLLERRTQGVVRRLGKNIGPRRDQMRGDDEGRARFEAALDDHPRFVDLPRFAEFCELLLDRRGERRGWRVVEMFEDDFHWEFLERDEARWRLTVCILRKIA